MTRPFALARSYTTHLVVQPSDLRLNPPESYLFVQDGLIIACGLLYSLCYIFYIIRTYSDKRLAGPIFGLCGNLSYELFYTFTTTSTMFERSSFLIWFILDVIFATTAVISTYRPGERRRIAAQIFGGALIGVITLYILSLMFPDERQQLTAYWAGILLELPAGWVSVYLLLKHRETKGHSLEIWLTRILGCITAYSVFTWRYLNVPENWAYVGSIWSISIMVLTVIPELIYPVVYICMSTEKKKRALSNKRI